MRRRRSRIARRVHVRRHRRRRSRRPPPPAAQTGDLAQALYAQYGAWRGTPYRLGGTTRAGIDCSAFVAETYRARLGVALPRTTEAQARAGREIPRDALRMGDLVFFRTGLNSRHVGIYLRNGEFMHASRQVGVTISKLRNRYWRAKWWQARRVLETPARVSAASAPGDAQNTTGTASKPSTNVP